MSIEDAAETIAGNIGAGLIIKLFFILFLIFYLVFSLMLYRQIQLMCRTLPTPIAPFLKFVAIIHLGIPLAILFIVIGIF
ncbi:hypothetical protein A2165_00480 [Candidatus Curtissbacteria bacterium RBG_13_40_7]|uniref:Uncharacterized protein n=1 Tax=Candidatus Curtissbacteria bacterium RBG_13_40_7 TaxID=1797706 RepID=A0A1F5FVS1_9BACT|nr:MAG: hypothetical protein A2165_00480 [Candidatus Curtissbacteria bacterium RBG_13_40_7]